jgi:hypothetical protein
VEIINTIFRLGVILAIFGFIWGLFQIAFTILSGGQSRSVLAHYGLKAIQYLFLVQVTFLFCFQTDSDLSLSQNSIVITGLILLFYFVSKLQRNQQKGMLFGFIQNGQKQVVQKFNLAAEIGLVVLALGYFVACIYYPNLGSNTISNWLKESIISIENAAFFGFIFKVIGFFFLLSVFGKIIQSILLLISPRIDNSQNNIDSTEDSTHFDDFEDLTEDQQ